MQINRGLKIFIRPLLIIIISISLGIVYMVLSTRDIAVAEIDETPSAIAATEIGETPSAIAVAEIDELLSATDSSFLDVIIIDKDNYDRDRKGPVSFEHKAHPYERGVSCWECHHEYVDGENNWLPCETTPVCNDCHDALIKVDEIRPKLQTAFHTNCKTCHIEQAIYGNDAQQYRKCNTCHITETE